MKKMVMMLCMMLGFLPLTAQANWMKDIFSAAMKIYGVNLELKNLDQSQVDALNNIKDLNKSQLTEMQKITNGLTGTHQYGNEAYEANQLGWGKSAKDWQSLLALAEVGKGE